MFETHEECLVCLEEIRWNGTPTCPYCGSVKATKYKKNTDTVVIVALLRIVLLLGLYFIKLM
ncbi:MAG: transposase [Mastigocoleus sp. MO_167.B18]|nr:transposase [Mastigocoleus sp. MO_167.B18]